MKKRLILILILLLPIGFLNLLAIGKANDYSIDYLNTDKDIYFVDEKIFMNFSGSLDYEPNPPLVDSFFQLYLVNDLYANPSDLESVLWCSPQFHEPGEIKENFTLIPSQLDLEFSEENVTLYLKLRFFYYHYDEQEYQDFFLEALTKKITIIKRGQSCQEIHYFELDKSNYYIDDSIILNISWTLDYNPVAPLADAFLQICMFNDSDIKLWNSTEYHKLGLKKLNFTLVLNDLELKLTSISNLFYFKIRLYYYFHNNDTDDLYLINTHKNFTVNKRGASCLNVFNLTLNKEEYSIDESIAIESSWSLDYNPNPPQVDAFIQLCLLNDTGYLIWNSSEFHKNNITQINLNLDLSTISSLLFERKNILYLKLRLFYFFHIEDNDDLYLEEFTLSLNVSIPITSCIDIYYFEADKAKLYYGDDINIEASWNLESYDFYKPSVQILLVNDTSEQLIWNSIKYNETKLIQKKFTIYFHKLNLTLISGFNIFLVKLILFYYNETQSQFEKMMLEDYTFSISLYPGLISHEFDGPEKSIKYGEEQDVLIKCTNAFTKEIAIDGLMEVSFIKYNEYIFKQLDLIENGEFNFKLDYKELLIGKNSFYFNLTNVENHNNYYFNYNITMEKSEVTCRKLNISVKNNRIEGTIQYFYNKSTQLIPLKNENISASVMNRTTPIIMQKYITNKYGLISLNISLGDYFVSNKTFFLKLKNKGNSTLQSTVKNMKIDFLSDFIKKDKKALLNPYEGAILGSFSILGFSGLTLISIVRRNKKSGQISLEELKFRY